MSDDVFKGENPFARLNKKQFPDKKNSGKTIQKAPPTPVPSKPEDDEALFFNAVSSVTRLEADTGKTARAVKHDAQGMNSLHNVLPLPHKKQHGKQAHMVRANAATEPHASQSPQQPAMQQAETPPDNADVQTFSTLLEHSISGTGQVCELPKTRKETVRAASREAQARAERDALAVAAYENTHPENVFADAMRDVAPLAGKGRAVPLETPPAKTCCIEEKNPLQDFMEGKVAFTLASTDEYVEGHVVGLDLALVVKLQAGQFSPEAHIDLHGLNAQQAFEALVGFIRGAYLRGRRTILVVSGRGRNSPSGMGVLRERVQEWFTQEPLRRVVLAFCTAKSSDGGAGAMYVLLRKWRKDKGKVYWDRRPADPDLYL